MSERLLPTRRLGRLLETGASCFYDARGESDRVSIKALEQLCFDDPTSADALADVITVGNGEEVSPETNQAEQEGAAEFARPQVAVLTDIEITEGEE